MRKVIIITLFCSLFSDDLTSTYNIEGMTCAYGCAGKVNSVVTSLNGVTKCDVDFDKKSAVVIYDPEKVNPDQIIAELHNKTDYNVNLRIDEDKDLLKPSKSKKTLIQRIFSIFGA